MILALCVPFFSFSQISWKYSAKKIGDKLYEIHLTATVDHPWHTYSQTTPEGGPLPTKISFSNNPLVVLKGAVKEVGKMQVIHDNNFGVDVKFYSEQVDFVQQVQLKSNVKTSVKGSVEYMVCDDHQCLPPTTNNFEVALK